MDKFTFPPNALTVTSSELGRAHPRKKGTRHQTAASLIITLSFSFAGIIVATYSLIVASLTLDCTSGNFSRWHAVKRKSNFTLKHSFAWLM